MKKLTEYQAEFLLDNFFKNYEYAGWRGIAEKLLEKGMCIVAGTEPIWRGGIGNFIETSEASDAIDCLVYQFDLDYFLSSAMYKEMHGLHVSNLGINREEANIKYNEIKELA
jgi:hypothetical protein|tara:strand:- start:4541 stop:4876 length:336 start_codon:yes stop_codon:yes gene_type:complete